MVATSRLSLSQFLAIPQFDERRLELIDGKFHERSPKRWGAGQLAVELALVLRGFGYVGLGPRAIIPATPTRGASSPISEVALYKTAPPKSDEWMTRPPDLVVELLSIGQSRTEMRGKASIYLEFGVPCVWVFDLERLSVDVYEKGERRTLTTPGLLTCATLPGFSERVGELFQRAGFETQ